MGPVILDAAAGVLQPRSPTRPNEQRTYDERTDGVSVHGMTRSTVSAVIPVYNAEGFLARALESVLAQTRAVDEIIVVDDASTDGSPEVARRFGARVCRLPTNAGSSAARNEGLRAARGDVIAWLDADDFWEPRHCEVVVGLLEEFPAACLAFSGIAFRGDRQGEWLSPLPEREPADAFWQSLGSVIVPQMSVVTRRAPLLEVGGYDPSLRFAEDYDLFLRLARRYPFVSTREVTSNYRWHAAQSAKWGKQLQTVFGCRRRLLDQLLAEGDQARGARVERTIVRLWILSLSKALRRRDLRLFRDVLACRAMIPPIWASLGRGRGLGS